MTISPTQPTAGPPASPDTGATARIPLLNGEALSPEQRRIYEAVVSGPRGKLQGPLRAALHCPELADKWHQFGEHLRFRTSLPPRLSELAILVTARKWTCQLEWHIHERIARDAGLEERIIGDLRVGVRPSSADGDALAIHDYCAELHDDKRVCDETYARVLERWGVVAIVELTALIGYYTLVAMTLNAHAFPLPAGSEPPLGPVPQDGRTGKERAGS